jgi:hypothetical protein
MLKYAKKVDIRNAPFFWMLVLSPKGLHEAIFVRIYLDYQKEKVRWDQ